MALIGGRACLFGVNLTANSRALWSRNIAKKSSQNGTFTQECLARASLMSRSRAPM